MSQLFYDFGIIATVAIIVAITSIKINSYIEHNPIAKTLVNVVMALIAMPYIFWFTGVEGLDRQGFIYLIVHSIFSVAFLCIIGLAILKEKNNLDN